MRSASRALAWMAILGIAITVVILLQRRGDDPVAVEATGSTDPSIDVTRIAQRIARAAEIPGSPVDPVDEPEARCTQTIRDLADFVRTERHAANPVEGTEPSHDQRDVELTDAHRALAASGDPEHFLAALLLDPQESEDPDHAATKAKLLELGDRAISSGSKVLAWHTLRFCFAAQRPCPVAHLEQRLLEADRQNGEAWALVAVFRHERGDVAGALTAMQGAARAPNSTWYAAETAELIEHSLAAKTKMSYVERMGQAVLTAEWNLWSLPLQSAFLKMCKLESATSLTWGEACLAFGNLRAERDQTNAAVSQMLREQMLSAMGDTEGAAGAAVEQALIRVETFAAEREPAVSMQRLQWELMAAYPLRFYAYLDAYKKFGEAAADRSFLKQELPPLLERAGMLERDGAQECVAGLFFETRPAIAGRRAQVGDELDISTRGYLAGGHAALRVRPDGRVTWPYLPQSREVNATAVQAQLDIAAVGKTTGQLEREITRMLATYGTIPGYQGSPGVIVILLAPRSVDELRHEFDKARESAAERFGRQR